MFVLQMCLHRLFCCICFILCERCARSCHKSVMHKTYELYLSVFKFCEVSFGIRLTSVTTPNWSHCTLYDMWLNALSVYWLFMLNKPTDGRTETNLLSTVVSLHWLKKEKNLLFSDMVSVEKKKNTAYIVDTHTHGHTVQRHNLSTRDT